jgi:hypothetical protein
VRPSIGDRMTEEKHGYSGSSTTSSIVDTKNLPGQSTLASS